MGKRERSILRKNAMNAEEIFRIALNIQSPWYIKEIRLEKGEGEFIGKMEIHIDFKKGEKFILPDGSQCTAYDTEIRTWQHLNFFEHECFIIARVPRVAGEDNKPRTIPVSWARPGSGFTLLFESYTMLLIENEMPMNKVAKTVRVTAPRVWRIFTHWIERAVKKDDVSQLKQLGIDETSAKKGHDYVTVGIDLEKRRVIHVGKGKDVEAIEVMKNTLKEKGVNLEQIADVCMDMSPAFLSGVLKHFPAAKITFDRFHVKKEVNKALDDVRIMERKGNDLLKNHKYTFLKSYEKLTDARKQDLEFLSMMYPKLGEAYRLKVMFDEFWDLKDVEEAESYLAFWCDLADESSIQPFKKVVNTIKAHWSGIVNYITTNITTGVIEGINNKIQLAKRRARGYRNIHNFINMIFFIAGKLKFDYPHYPL